MNHKRYLHNLCIILQILNYGTIGTPTIGLCLLIMDFSIFDSLSLFKLPP